MLYSLKSLMWRNVGLKRHADGLADARGRIGLWSRYLERAGLGTEAAFQLRNMLTVSALLATAAGHREESRGTHYRDDFPRRMDDAWCRRINVSRASDGSIETVIGDPCSPSDHATA